METAQATLTPREARERAEAMIVELKQARMRQEWNKEEISRRAGLERHVVAKNEEGVCQPRLATFIRWAAALDYDVVLRRSAPL